MSPNPTRKSTISAKNSSENGNKSKNSTFVLTVRIDEDLNDNIEELRQKLGISKADFIRNYLEMSKFIIKQKRSVQSLNKRDLIIIKRSYLRKLIEKSTEIEQIKLGDKLGRFINDIARITSKVDDVDYKLDLCDSLGFFLRDIDHEGYVNILKKFGPRKFVEAFVWRLFKQNEFNLKYTEEELKGSKSLTQQYEKEIQSVNRSSSHYSFEFAKLPEKGK
ncbi:MAG: ribbon-helix-helix domain-containing protein [Candidatus Thorarchaeota archaeon]